MKPFVGREKELKKLEELFSLPQAAIAVIKGRRRIGKSRLAEQFGHGKIFLPFSGLAPIRGITAQDQRDNFARQLSALFHIPPCTFTNWSDAFAHLTHHLENKPTVILFDEISWMGIKDPTFLAKLKAWWDLTLQNLPQVVLILCGSISTWIDKNIINSTAFFGRISLYLELTELTMPECKQLLVMRGNKLSDLDLCKILSVTGGIPWYLEQINPMQSADDNIKKLCFSKNGLLVEEFQRIFNDLFSSRGEIYKKIVTQLSQGMKTQHALQKGLGYAASGTLSQYMKALEVCGFVSAHPTWNLKTGKVSKVKMYRLSDNYLRFYLHYIEPNQAKIAGDALSSSPLSTLPGFEPMLGFQLENLLLKNRPLLYKALGIYPEDIVHDNPYSQKKSQDRKGCQIDYLIQTRSNTLFLCEVKMRRRELGLEVIESMKAKISQLDPPKGYGIAPVLFHIGPLSDSLLSSSFFYRIIDISDLF